MGIDAGIKVVRRITDEQRWKKFLQAVIEHFKDDARVRMEVKINMDADTAEHAEFGSMASIQSDSDIRLFHLTEAFNFVQGDYSTLGFWNTQFQSPQRHLYGTVSEKEKAALKEATLAKLQSEVIRLNYTDVNIEELMSRSYLHPKQAIVFDVGEAPDLPMYAHHFKASESKLTCWGLMADVALTGISKLLQQFFPGHTRYWSELEEEDEEDYSLWNDRISSESQDETDQFYRILIVSTSRKEEISAQTMTN